MRIYIIYKISPTPIYNYKYNNYNINYFFFKIVILYKSKKMNSEYK